MTAALSRSFASLSVPNYRRYFAGQVISLSGNWMQTVAELWLIVRLTDSGLAVGLTTGLQFLPILVAGAWGGLLADRVPKRRLLATTQALMVIPALTLFALTASGVVEPWMVFALVFVRGSVNAVDNPTRQSFVVEMVGADRVVNAVSLNSVLVQMARIAGPALAGIVIATLGVAPCFLLNALSFVAMIVALRWMDPAELDVSRPAARAPGQLRTAVRYVWGTPELRIPLVLMALVSTLAFNFQVLLPLLARFTWHGSASTYALLTTTMAVGSVIGALTVGARRQVSPRTLVLAAAAFGVFILLAAAAPVLPLQLAALVPLGAASVTFAAGTNSALQLAVAPSMRGRVMALYSVVFLGSTPIGGPLAGWLAEVAGPRASLAVGGLSALAGAAWARAAWARSRRRSHTTAPTTRIPAATAPAVPTRVSTCAPASPRA
jgi:MFS family permease